MKVTLIAKTELLRDDIEEEYGYGLGWAVHDADGLGEFAGRACYKSFDRPNPKTAQNPDYMAHILEVGHESVLAHASVSFFIEDVSRALTHELIRSRFLAYSQESQRYTTVKDQSVVIPPLALEAGNEDIMEAVIEAYLDAHAVYESILDKLKDRGVPKKQRHEVARAVMPNSTATSIVVSGNLRAFRDFIKQRWSIHADREIRELSGVLLFELREIAPSTFQDIPEVPYGTDPV